MTVASSGSHRGSGGLLVEVHDPAGRTVSLQAPVPEGVDAPDADTNDHDTYATK